jgi:hypothetical protein
MAARVSTARAATTPNPAMKLTLSPSAFEQQQALFTTELVTCIKIKLQEAGIADQPLEDLTASIALSVTGMIDDLAIIEADGVEAHPYLTFRTEDDELLHCGENASTYDLVYGIMQQLFHSQ